MWTKKTETTRNYIIGSTKMEARKRHRIYKICRLNGYVYTLRLIGPISYPNECDFMIHPQKYTASFSHECFLLYLRTFITCTMCKRALSLLCWCLFNSAGDIRNNREHLAAQTKLTKRLVTALYITEVRKVLTYNQTSKC